MTHGPSVEEQVRVAEETGVPPERWIYLGVRGGAQPLAAIHSAAWVEWKRRQRHARQHKLRDDIVERDGMVCGICHEAIDGLADLEIDHIQPVSRGGSSEPDNLQLSCNRSKGAKVPDDG